MSELAAAFLAGILLGISLGAVGALWWVGKVNERAHRRAVELASQKPTNPPRRR